jgi:hypothetical protein
MMHPLICGKKNYFFIITQPDNIKFGGVFGDSTWQYSVGRAFGI